MFINTETEKNMLSCLLQGKTYCIPKLAVEDFTAETYRLIFDAIRKLDFDNKPVDLVTVSDMLGDEVPLKTITEIADAAPTAENAEYLVGKVKEYSIKRQYMAAAQYMVKHIDEYLTVEELKADFMAKVDIPINNFSEGKFDMTSAVIKVVEDMEREYRNKEDNKYLTGYYDLDKFTAGLHPEEMTIIAARPGLGKTAVALNIISNMAEKGIKSVLVSREMSQGQLIKRLISRMTPIDGDKLRHCKDLADTDWIGIMKSIGVLSKWNLIINDKITTVQEIKAFCRENRKDLDILFIDYLQLCSSAVKHATRREEIEEVSRKFKEMSMDFHIPVVVLCQLSRDSVKNNREPAIHDLRESGSIEADADNILLLYASEEDMMTKDNYELKVIIGKQRNGQVGYVKLKFYKNIMKLFNVDWRQA